MAYTRGTSSNIVVGAAAIFVAPQTALVPAIGTEDYKTTVAAASNWTNIGYTSNGLELMFEPNFGEVNVDQLLDVAKMFKQGMKVELKTTFAEATLENLLIATAGKLTELAGDVLQLNSGNLGEYPIERQLIAVGASIQDATDVTKEYQRIYTAKRVLSIQNVTVSAKKDAATQFEVTFRLLPDNDGNYGSIADRVIGAAAANIEVVEFIAGTTVATALKTILVAKQFDTAKITFEYIFTGATAGNDGKVIAVVKTSNGVNVPNETAVAVTTALTIKTYKFVS